MPKIRLLTSVVGTGAVVGSPGDELVVDRKTAAVWADGVRAELVIEESAPRRTGRPRSVEKAVQLAPETRSK
jgi:hypothetical protein